MTALCAPETAGRGKICHAMGPGLRRRNDEECRPDRATFAPGDYGRVTRPDGTAQWYVRSLKGTWVALSHQRVIKNEDGTITLLSLA